MSRAKFEEWAEKEMWTLFWDDEVKDALLSAWLAGRESMRDEAAQIARQSIDPDWPSDDLSLQAETIADCIKLLKP